MRCLPIALVALLLTACANFNASMDTARAIWGLPAPQLVRGFEYLEISVGSHQTVMALGIRRQLDEGTTVEQWFSGQGEMLELRDGRIERVLGMTREVRATRGRPPPWTALQAPMASTWQREREVMPAYQMRSEHIKSQSLPAPTGPLSDAVWVGDSVSTHLLGGQSWHYSERFALKQGRVVYSEQCISPDLCVKLRPLGVAQ